MSSTIWSVAFTLLLLLQGAVSVDYRTALTKSIVYFEAQRSGKLPSNQRVQWRGDSGLKDGSDSGIDLVGGYYDAGDNVKFGFPLAYTVTMLAWSVIEFEGKLKATNELSNALNAIRWGTDYFIKAHPQPNVLYGQVGDGDSDHECWQRPEDMTTPRTAYKIDEAHPGSDLAGETAAAFAAASIAFRTTDIGYSNNLLRHARQLFDFANNHQGKYSDSIPSAANFYSSSGYQDELLWAAAWIYRAKNIPRYLNYINGGNTGGTRTMFSWDDKYAGVQILVAQFILRGKISNSNNWSNYKSQGEQFICNCIGKGNNNVARTGGGLLWWQPWNNLQYATAALFLTSAYSDTLRSKGSSLQCNGGYVSPDDLIKFVQSQVDYILGANPKGMSYMVGLGSNYPLKIHHRSASIVSIKKDSTPVTCKGGFEWLNSNFPNPNVVDGAIVGGPDQGDNYPDDRNNFQQSESATADNAPFVGVLARLA